MREREAFVAAVTHELKTPLAATRLLAEILERGGVEERKVVEFARRIGVESDRLERLVTSVLELSRVEGAPPAEALRELDLVALAGEAARRFEPLARERGFSLTVRAPAAPLVLRGDGDALLGALLELLDNARRHAGPPHELELVAESRGDVAVLAVLDRGPGVPEALRVAMFEPFKRGSQERDLAGRGGVGLGLALVARIARAHGGAARCLPRAGGGARFELELPRGEAAA